MSVISEQLGVQSYCFRGFKDNAKVAALVREMGVDRIEICGVHCNFDETATHKAVLDAYKNAGVQIASIGVESINRAEAEMRNRFEFMKAAGATVMTVAWPITMQMQRLVTACQLAAEYGVKLAIHNHGGQHWQGNSETLSKIFADADAAGCTTLGLGIDTAWCIDSHENPVKWAEKFGSRLYGIHIKDFTYTPKRQPQDVVVGTGCLDLPGFIKAAVAANFAGSCVLEYEGDVNDPVPALKQCVAAVKAADQ